MTEFRVTAKVDQIVTKEIDLVLVADTEEEATAAAREALQTYPDKIEVKGIRRILTVSSRYWIPRDIEFVSVKGGRDIA